MNKKKGGLADSPFFRMSPDMVEFPSAENSSTSRESDSPSAEVEDEKKSSSESTTRPRHHDTMHDTVIPRYHNALIETIRRSVKEFGKEAATHRFTVAEKKALLDILYSYKGRGIRTSENELTRIAINFIFTDYQENGENSILHQVIEALNG